MLRRRPYTTTSGGASCSSRGPRATIYTARGPQGNGAVVALTDGHEPAVPAGMSMASFGTALSGVQANPTPCSSAAMRECELDGPYAPMDVGGGSTERTYVALDIAFGGRCLWSAQPGAPETR